jgi:hypothetical protein
MCYDHYFVSRMHVGVHGSLEVPAAPASGRSASDARNSLWRSACRIQMSISHGTLGLNSHKLPSLQGNYSPKDGLVMGLLKVPINRAALALERKGRETSKCAEYKGYARKHKCLKQQRNILSASGAIASSQISSHSQRRRTRAEPRGRAE